MNDSQILDWLQIHASNWRLVDGPYDLPHKYELDWIDKNGYTRHVYGANLRDCVHGALIQQVDEMILR